MLPGECVCRALVDMGFNVYASSFKLLRFVGDVSDVNVLQSDNLIPTLSHPAVNTVTVLVLERFPYKLHMHMFLFQQLRGAKWATSARPQISEAKSAELGLCCKMIDDSESGLVPLTSQCVSRATAAEFCDEVRGQNWGGWSPERQSNKGGGFENPRM